MTRSVQKEGDKFDTPNEGALVQVHLIGYCGEKKFIDKDFEFSIGECTEYGLPEGIDKVLRK